MILIASSNLLQTNRWRQILSPFYHLYEIDITDRHSLELCLKKAAIDILMIDKTLLGDHGVTEISALKELKPDLKTIVLTEDYDQREQISAILFGAKAYCDSNTDLHLLPKIIKTVMSGELWVDRHFVSRLLAEIEDIAALRRQETKELDAGLAKMTPREIEIAQLVAQGDSNRKIAETLSISERTVKAHLGVIFRKLGVHDRLQLALYMNRHQQINEIWHSHHKHN